MNATHPLAVQAANASQPASRPRSRFYIAMLTIVGAIVVVGFAPTFFLRGFTHATPLSPLYVVHGLVFSAWIMLAIVQSLLVRTSRVHLHRRLGVLGVALAASMVLLGATVAIQSLPTSEWPARFGLPPLVFIIVPLGQTAIFGVLVTAALLLRRHPETHKRLMVLATINLAAPAIARVHYNLFHVASPMLVASTIAMLVICCVMVEWRTYRRVHPVFAIAAPLTVLSLPLRVAFAHTELWGSFASWMTENH